MAAGATGTSGDGPLDDGLPLCLDITHEGHRLGAVAKVVIRPAVNPGLERACERMVEGWCLELPELLSTTLDRSLEGDNGAAISDSALHTSSVVECEEWPRSFGLWADQQATTNDH